MNEKNPLRTSTIHWRRWIIVLLLFVLVNAGCAVKDFLDQRYENLVAYFNTYYNAKNSFDEAVQEIETAQQLARSKELPPPEEISPTAKQKLNTCIEKCSRLLLYYPTSKWIDDALTLIGRSYYYQKDYSKAERKFLELISQFPSSSLYYEARLWLGRTLHKLNKNDEAITELNSLVEKASQEKQWDIVAQASVDLGQIYSDLEMYERAIRQYQVAVNHGKDGALQAEAQFRLANLYDQLGNLEKAATAFLDVLAYQPDEYLKYAAQFRYAQLMQQLKQFDPALRTLYILLDNPINSFYYPKIELEIAKTLNAKGDVDEAIEHYLRIDSLYAHTDVAAQSYYQLGLIYEKDYHDYVNAKVYYDRPKIENPKSDILSLAAQRSEYLRRYFMYIEEISLYDSVLQVKLHPEFINNRAISKVDSSKVKKDSVAIQPLVAKPIRTFPASIDSLKSILAENEYELASLFFLSLQQPDSAMYWANQSFANSTQPELSSRTLYTLAELYRAPQFDSQEIVDSLYRQILSNYSETIYAKEVERLLGKAEPQQLDSAAVVYRRAENLLEQKNIREAISLFQLIIQKYSSSQCAAKAQYAIGWIYENIYFNSDSASSNYWKLLQQFPSSVYASLVRNKVVEIDRYQHEEQARKKAKSQELQHLKDSTVTPIGTSMIINGNLPDSLQSKNGENVKKNAQDIDPKRPLRSIKKDTTKTKQISD